MNGNRDDNILILPVSTRKNIVTLTPTKLKEKNQLALTSPPAHFSTWENTETKPAPRDGLIGWVHGLSLGAPGGFQSPPSYFKIKKLRVKVMKNSKI